MSHLLASLIWRQPTMAILEKIIRLGKLPCTLKYRMKKCFNLLSCFSSTARLCRALGNMTLYINYHMSKCHTVLYECENMSHLKNSIKEPLASNL